jgi:hypothetical protein
MVPEGVDKSWNSLFSHEKRERVYFWESFDLYTNKGASETIKVNGLPHPKMW